MLRRGVLLAVLGCLTCGVAPAGAATRTESGSSGAVSGDFSYSYKRTSFGTYDYSALHVKITRAGVVVLDQDIGTEQCDGCAGWPASGAQRGVSSVTVRDLDGDDEPEVLIDLYSGGANCCWYSDSFRYDDVQGRYIEKVLRPGGSFPYTLKDLDRNGTPEFRSYDYRFAYKYGSNADTPRPLRIFDWSGGRLVDATIAYPRLAARDAAQYYKGYLRYRKAKDVNVRGLLAAYLASSYNARNGAAAWKRVVAAYHRGDVDKKFAGDAGPHGRSYLISLRKFLKKLGYLRTA